MWSYIVRRLFIGLLIVWGVYTLTFIAVNLAGDPFTGGENAKIQESDLIRLRERWGYNLHPVQRYFKHMRMMFWADPEVLDYEAGGIEMLVSADSQGNQLTARAQKPPDEITLKPDTASEVDYGATSVVIKRGADGTFPTKTIVQGNYYVRYKKLAALTRDATIETLGLRIAYSSGKVSTENIGVSAPKQMVLTPDRKDETPVVLKRNKDGTYGPAPVSAGRYTSAEGADILVPENTLGTGGLTFDLGKSIRHNRPVVEFLWPRLKNTLKLGFWALLINYIIGIGLGVISALKKDKPIDTSIMVSAFFLYSMPGFWLAIMLQLIFAVWLGALPIGGLAPDGSSFLTTVSHYAMPVFVLGVAGAAGTARYQRSAVLEVLGEDYVRTARAKGLDEKAVVRKHVLRNSLLPIITLFGLSLPFLVSGAVITEQIFSWPGIGTAAIEAIRGRDVAVVTAITFLATVMVVLGNLLADVLYAVADPRVRLK